MIYKIVLTGGPCAGKTTAISTLTKFLSKDWKVFTVPEAATLLAASGVDLTSPSTGEKFSGFINVQKALEGAVISSAKASNKDCVVICDRGHMDCKAYVPSEVWPEYLAKYKLNEVDLREGSYDAVFHLVTAAIGAKEFYNYDNQARWETIEQAPESDIKTQNAWVGHPHLRIIDNSTDFVTKIDRLCAAVNDFLNSDKEIERRFLVEADTETIKQNTFVTTLDVTQTYLKTNDGTVTRIRRRGAYNDPAAGAIYTYTVKSPKVGASCTEIEHNISQEEFDVLSKQHDPDRQTIYKRRHCFVWAGKQFELDEFVNPSTGMKILEIELDNEKDEFALPPFIKIIRDITTDHSYSNWNIANGRNDSVAAHQ